jgi:hypothetical protein
MLFTSEEIAAISASISNRVGPLSTDYGRKSVKNALGVAETADQAPSSNAAAGLTRSAPEGKNLDRGLTSTHLHRSHRNCINATLTRGVKCGAANEAIG